MKFNIDKLRSWKLRYLVCDETGQIWAHEKLPVRVTPGYADGYWKVADEFLPPHVTIYSSDEEWDKYKSKNAYQLFQKELIRLHDEQEKHTNDVGCAISQDCSMMGCYRYIICDFPEKKS